MQTMNNNHRILSRFNIKSYTPSKVNLINKNSKSAFIQNENTFAIF